MKGEQPYWPNNLMQRHIRPVESQRHSQENRLAYFPPHLRHFAEGQWRRCDLP